MKKKDTHSAADHHICIFLFSSLAPYTLAEDKKEEEEKKNKMRSNRKKRTTSRRRFITIGGVGAIGAIVAFMVFLQVDSARNNEFKQAFEKIVIDTNALTKEYTAEEAKWLAQDNSTLIKVIDQYQPRYDQLVERAKALNTPEKYTDSRNYLVSAIDLEKQSYQHFRNYLATGNQTEYEKSSEMLSKSLAESANADAAIKAAG
jgi:hypothetical protein